MCGMVYDVHIYGVWCVVHAYGVRWVLVGDGFSTCVVIMFRTHVSDPCFVYIVLIFASYTCVVEAGP